MMRVLKTGAMAALLLAGLSAPAQAVLITDLEAGEQTIVTGDKTFSNFTCEFVSTGTVLGGCGTVNVTSSVDAFGNNGILLQLGANANDPGDFGDYTITYQVTAPAALITDIHMFFNGAISGDGTTDVTETVFSDAIGGTIVGQINVHNPPPVLDAAANVTGGPYTTLHVFKDIQFGVPTGGTGTASISNIGQYISQVPEPASLALFGLALCGYGAARRRRKAA